LWQYTFRSPLLQQFMVAKQRRQIFSLGDFVFDFLFDHRQPLGGFNHRLQTVLWNHDYAVFIAHHPVAGMHDGAATLDRDLKLAGVLNASGIRDDCSSEHREFIVTNLLKIPNGTVNDHSLQSFQSGCQCGDFTPERRIEFSLPVDHQHASLWTMG